MDEELGELEGELVDAVSTVERLELSAAGPRSVEFSRKLRRLAILSFAEFQDAREFRSHLARSALVRETYLKRCAVASATELPHYATGRYDALIDAIAAHRLDLARSIVRLSPTSWQRGKESRADYLYGTVVGALVCERDEEAAALLEELAAEPDEYSRLCYRALRSILRRSAAELESSLAELLRRDADVPVFVEGVALGVLAAKRGIGVPSGIDRCPDVLIREPER